MSGSQWRRAGGVVRRSRSARGLLVLAIGAAGLLTPMAAFGEHSDRGGTTSTRTTSTTTTGTTTTTTTGTTTTTPSGPAASFQGLGQIPGGDVQSFGLGISGDGKVAVGYSLDSANVEHAWRWTSATGMQTITNTSMRSACSTSSVPDNGHGGRLWTLRGHRTPRRTLAETTKAAAKQEKTRSPLTDSNRRPPPYHVQGREPGASAGHRDHESRASKADLRVGRRLRVDARGRAYVRTTFARRGRGP
jgi:hypothetical protein